MIEFSKLTVQVFRYGCSYSYLPAGTLESTLSLEGCWEKGCQFVFCPPQTVPSEELGSKIGYYCLYHTEVLFAWVENPEDEVANWRVSAIKRPYTSSSEHVIDPINIMRPEILGSTDQKLIFTNEGLLVNITETGFSIQKKASQGNLFVQLGENFKLFSNKNTVLGEIVLDANGGSFSILSNGKTTDAGTTPGDEIGIRYTLLPTGADITEEPVPACHVHMTFLKNIDISYLIRINPLELMNPQQTYVSLYENKSSHELPANLTTRAGTALQVEATADSALVFERGVKSFYRNASGKLCANTHAYLTYAGHFAVTGGDSVLGGLSGSEYVEFDNQTGNQIEFVPHQAAYLDLNENLEGGRLLSSLSQTAWIRLPDDIRYFDPPETASLYTMAVGNALEYKAFMLSRFYGRPPAVPMGLYASLPFYVDFQRVLDLEARLYRSRKAILSDGAMQIVPMASQKASAYVTPQGLMVGVNDYGDWQWVGLAQVEERNRLRSAELDEVCIRDCMACVYGQVEPGSKTYQCPYSMFDKTPLLDDPDFPNLRLERVSPRLCNMLRQKNIFVTFETPNQFLHNAVPRGDFEISFDSWTFVLHPKSWFTDRDSGNTLMILKYAENQSILELMPDSSVLRQALRNAYNEDGTVRNGSEDLVRVVNDPHYQGVLLLNCPLRLNKDRMPDSLAAALYGVDTEKLYASYLALEANQICSQESLNPDKKGQSVMRMKPSSASGNVHYEAAKEIILDGNPPAAQYQVMLMDVIVKNSAISSFRLESELFVNTLFQSDCTVREGQHGECLRLIGSCFEGDVIGTDSEGNPVRSIQYRFDLREKLEYQMKASALESVLVEGVGLTMDPEGNSVIALDGRALFVDNEVCDLFSYGRESGRPETPAEETGLCFNGLKIFLPQQGEAYMKYDQITIQQTKDRVGARPKSFVSCFVCAAEKFLVEKEKSPEEHGYRSITCPVEQDELQKTWTGVVWNIELGCLGALAKKEAVSIRFLTAWSADESGQNPALYIGVKLPAVFGGEGLDFQGLIKLGFHSISLEVHEPTEQEINAAKLAGQSKPPRAYTLVLNSFALRLLGLALPPGSNKIFLVSDGKGIGWYAGYENKKKDT